MLRLAAAAPLLLCACLTTTGVVGGSSSSSSSSGDAADAGADAGPGGDRIELGALCRELRSGYRRAIVRTFNQCGAAYTDDDIERADPAVFDGAEDALSQAQAELPGVSCDQFGNLRVY